MASEQAAPTVIPPASWVGNAFVHQYYNVLHQNPDMVFRFYNDTSKLGRPEPNGDLSCITTMEAINEKILSLDYGEYKAELKTVDSQDSYNQGVLVLVTGALLSKTNVKRNFTQSFFLAPQEKGFFVLNDVFRYLDDPQQLEPRNVLVNGVSDQSSNPPPAEPDPIPPLELQEVDRQAAQLEEEFPIEEVDVSPSKHGDESAEEEETAPTHATGVVQIEEQVVPEAPVVPSEETPKKSYASVVKVKKDISATVQAPAVVKTSPPNVEQQSTVPTQAPPASKSPPASQSPPAAQPLAPSLKENSSSQEAEAEGRSIYIRNLPLNATTIQLEEEFKTFGAIKPGGVQVRSNKQQRFCYGFVEFESSSSVQSALQASPILIGGCTAHVEEKRPAGSRAPRGRFSSGRGGFRNDAMRGWGNYGGRGYGRGDYANRGDFGGRVRGSASGRVEGYQRVDQVGNGGRGARPGGTSQSQRNVQRAGPVS